MSYWFETKKEDIDLSEDGTEIHFWLESDNAGNVYCSAKVSDVKEVLKSLDEKA